MPVYNAGYQKWIFSGIEFETLTASMKQAWKFVVIGNKLVAG